ncbi:MAG: SUMF1/EgtB/PvdO family nonheme iron enzyme [Planctomycetota bacterium]
MASNRYVFAVSAESATPLGGPRDVTAMWNCLAKPSIGGCRPEIEGQTPGLLMGANATLFRIELVRFLDVLPKTAELFFYYSGHGQRAERGGFEFLFGAEAVPFLGIIETLQECGFHRVVFILDACDAAEAQDDLKSDGIRKGPAPASASLAEIPEGFTLIASSFGDSFVDEKNQESYFSQQFVEGLSCGLKTDGPSPANAKKMLSIADVLSWVNPKLKEKGAPEASVYPESRADEPVFGNPKFDEAKPAGLTPVLGRYLEKLAKSTSRLELPAPKDPEKSHADLDIRTTFAELETRITEPQSRRSEATLLRADSDQREPLQTRLKERFLTLIGDPGSGKSTFLRRLAFVAAEAALTEDPVPRDSWLTDLPSDIIPLLVDAAVLSPPLAAMKPEDASLNSAEDPNLSSDFFEVLSSLVTPDCETLFRTQPVLLLVDGLDEAAAPALIAKTLSKLSDDDYPELRIVVTVRPGAFKAGEIRLPRFLQVNVEDLSKTAIKAFAGQAFLGLNKNDLCESFLERVTSGSDPELGELARNPLMLACMIAMFSSEHDLPKQRVRLFEEIINWLLTSRKDESGGLGSNRRLFLERLAFHFHSQNPPLTRISRRKAVQALQAIAKGAMIEDRVEDLKALLDAEEKKSGIIVRDDSEVFFWHARLREYLAAHRLCDLDDPERLNRFLNDRALCLQERSGEVLSMAAEHHALELDRDLSGLLSPLVEMALEKDCPVAESLQLLSRLGDIHRRAEPGSWRDPRYRELLTKSLLRVQDETLDLRLRCGAAEAIGQEENGALWFADHPSEFVTIPGDSFMLGGDAVVEKRGWSQLGSKRQTVPKFSIGRYPVTVAEYAKFLDAVAEDVRKPAAWLRQQSFPTRPVVGMSYSEAAAYAKWRGKGVRLLTDIEWEFAARGTDSRPFPWGETMPDSQRCNFVEAKIGHPSPVGLFARDVTPEGVIDMGGNVVEWCQDSVVRGGAFGGDAVSCRAANRNVWSDGPDDRYAGLGFRLAQGTP